MYLNFKFMPCDDVIAFGIEASRLKLRSHLFRSLCNCRWCSTLFGTSVRCSLTHPGQIVSFDSYHIYILGDTAMLKKKLGHM